jgi:hypothetical protein
MIYEFQEGCDHPHHIIIYENIGKLFEWRNGGNHLKPEINEWMKKNIASSWSILDDLYIEVDLYFKDKNDALLFKTTWS